jgi:hypothetical protein
MRQKVCLLHFTWEIEKRAYWVVDQTKASRQANLMSIWLKLHRRRSRRVFVGAGRRLRFRRPRLRSFRKQRDHPPEELYTGIHLIRHRRSHPRGREPRKIASCRCRCCWHSKLSEAAREQQHRAGGGRERGELMDIAPTLHGEYEIEVLWNWMGKKVGEFWEGAFSRGSLMPACPLEL